MPPTPMVRATRMWVERTFPKGGSEFEDKNVEVRVFETTPATVTAKGGQTINLGNYESIRLDVGVTLPCYAEEVADGLAAASAMVGDFLKQEVTAIKDVLDEQKRGSR